MTAEGEGNEAELASVLLEQVLSIVSPAEALQIKQSQQTAIKHLRTTKKLLSDFNHSSLQLHNKLGESLERHIAQLATVREDLDYIHRHLRSTEQLLRQFQQQQQQQQQHHHHQAQSGAPSAT